MTAEGERALRESARRRQRTYWVLWAELCQSTMQRVSLVQTPEAIAALLSYDEASEEARGPP